MVAKGVDTRVNRNAPGENIAVLSTSGLGTKPRHTLRVSGWSGPLEIGVHNNSMANALRAVRERVFAVERQGQLQPPPRPARGVVKERLADFRGLLLRRLGRCMPWSYDQFLASYRGSKLRRYTVAVQSLLVREITMADSFLSSFVKAEAVNFTAKPDPAPRLIQPRSPRFNAAVGRYLRPLEHRVYAAIASIFRGPTVMKGYNAVQTAANLWDMWQCFTDPAVVRLDASRFDQHVSHSALQWEHSVYNGVYRSKELAELLKWQLTNTGFVRNREGAFKYSVKGCRMSGDMNTALGNCMIMCAMVWTYSRDRGVRVRLANNGDDCAVFMERHDLDKYMEGLDQWFLEMGFTMCVEGVATEFTGIEFCQTRPVYNGEGWVMCRSPYLGLCKDTLCKHPDMCRPLTGYRRWAFQVGVAGGHLAAGVPVFQAAYAAMRRAGIPCKRAQGFGQMDTGLEHMAKGLTGEDREINHQSRLTFYLAWGITPHQQQAIEEYFNGLQCPTELWAMMSLADNQGIWLLQDGEETRPAA